MAAPLSAPESPLGNDATYRKLFRHLVKLPVKPLVFRLPAGVVTVMPLLLLHLLLNVFQPGRRTSDVVRQLAGAVQACV